MEVMQQTLSASEAGGKMKVQIMKLMLMFMKMTAGTFTQGFAKSCFSILLILSAFFALILGGGADFVDFLDFGNHRVEVMQQTLMSAASLQPGGWQISALGVQVKLLTQQHPETKKKRRRG